MDTMMPALLRRFLRVPSGSTLGLLFVSMVFLVILMMRGLLGSFVEPSNLRLVVFEASFPAAVALGMLLIVILGGIDLSVGSTVALATVAAMQSYEFTIARTGSMEAASIAAVLASLAVGAVNGLVCGSLVVVLRVSPFVVTLGMMSLIRGVAHARSRESRIVFSGDTPAWVRAFQRPSSESLLLSPAIWSVVVLAIIVAAMLHFTVLGRHAYAIGSNGATARLCGIPVGRRTVTLYTLAGLLTGWGGVLMFARTGSGDTTMATELPLDVIAAVVIGGASLSGGRGTVLGTLMGVFLLTALGNLLTYTQMPLELKYVVQGAVVIVNTALGRLPRRVDPVTSPG